MTHLLAEKFPIYIGDDDSGDDDDRQETHAEDMFNKTLLRSKSI